VLIFVPPLVFALWHGVALVRAQWRTWLHRARSIITTLAARRSSKAVR
jgi:hypothetical protein